LTVSGPRAGDGEQDRRLQWWREARFGMFIHWGLYAIPAGEWNGRTTPKQLGEWIMHDREIPLAEYEKLVARLNPLEYDAREWVRIAKDAGMKYLVITSKHHDGFALWDSTVSDYDVTATPYKRDLLKPLAAAAREAGLKFCAYYSILDWHHPDYLPRREGDARPAEIARFDRYVTYMKTQLRELVTNYDPAVLWFDGEWDPTWTHERGVDLYDYVRSLKPDIIINNRVDKGRRGLEGLTRAGGFKGDFGTPEQQIPAMGLPGVAWESCMTMNDTWGYRKDDHNWKSSRALIRHLIDSASKGGNFLLNVGPTAEGLIPAPSVERLADLGAWMRTNGQAIYGTTASPFPQPPWGRVTQKPSRLYLHVFDWPREGRLVIPVANHVANAVLLPAPGARVVATTGATGVTLQLPPAAPDVVASVIRLDIKGAPQIR
jgi:alpha-L-fucosidase